MLTATGLDHMQRRAVTLDVLAMARALVMRLQQTLHRVMMSTRVLTRWQRRMVSSRALGRGLRHTPVRKATSSAMPGARAARRRRGCASEWLVSGREAAGGG